MLILFAFVVFEGAFVNTSSVEVDHVLFPSLPLVYKLMRPPS